MTYFQESKSSSHAECIALIINIKICKMCNNINKNYCFHYVWVFEKYLYPRWVFFLIRITPLNSKALTLLPITWVSRRGPTIYLLYYSKMVCLSMKHPILEYQLLYSWSLLYYLDGSGIFSILFQDGVFIHGAPHLGILAFV